MKLIAVLLFLMASSVNGMMLTLEENPPLNFSIDKGKNVSGLSTELLKEAGRRAGVELVFAYFPWKRAYNMAQNNRDTCV